MARKALADPASQGAGLGPVGAAARIVALVWGIALTQLVGAVLLIVVAVVFAGVPVTSVVMAVWPSTPRAR